MRRCYLREYQHVDDQLAHAVQPVQVDEHGGHQGHVEVRAGQVHGQGRGREQPDAPGERAVGGRRGGARVGQEPERAFRAGQPGVLAAAPVQRGTSDIGRRAHVPVEQFDQPEAVRLLEARPERAAHVPHALEVVVVRRERVDRRVNRPHRQQPSVERVPVTACVF